MNFFQFGAAGQIIISRDIWKFVILWLTLTILTGAVFFVAWMRSRYGSVSPNKRRNRKEVEVKEGEV